MKPKSKPTAAAASSTSLVASALITSAQLRKLLPVSLVTLWRWVKADRWPPPLKISGRNYWLVADVELAIAKLADRSGKCPSTDCSDE